MIIFYYRDRATGEITQIHENKQGWDEVEIVERMADYNRRCIHQTVDAVTIEEGSIFEHLYKLAMQKKTPAAAIETALEAIREAERELKKLEV